MLKKRIVSFLLVFIIAVGVMMSATSCMYALNILTDKENSGLGYAPDSGTPPQSDSGTPPASGTVGEVDGADTDNGSGSSSFCPGTNNAENITNVTPDMRTLLSTVAIDAKFDVYSSYPYSSSTSEYTSYGSGVIYKLDREKGDAYIITNYHVVYNSGEVALGGFSDTVSLYLYGMEYPQYAIPARVIGGSMNYDIAVLEVKNSDVLKNSMAAAVTLGNSDNVRVFDKVNVVGNPEGMGISATEGGVNVESESLVMTGADGRTAVSLRVMRVSAAVNEGNSGGGLYDAGGNLIGIVNAKRTGADTDNIGYAIPVNLAVKVAENILRNCDGESNLSVKKCLIGITLETASSGLVTDENGKLVIVESVAVKSVESTAVTNKVQAGDIINSITVDGNKTAATRIHHVTDSMLDANVGSVVILNVTRGGKTLDITVNIPTSAETTVK